MDLTSLHRKLRTWRASALRMAEREEHARHTGSDAARWRARHKAKAAELRRIARLLGEAAGQTTQVNSER